MTSKIFTEESGDPLAVFIHGDVENRSDLAKRMRLNGAEVKAHIKDSVLLLVNIEAESVQDLVSSWGTEIPIVDVNWAWGMLKMKLSDEPPAIEHYLVTAGILREVAMVDDIEPDVAPTPAAQPQSDQEQQQRLEQEQVDRALQMDRDTSMSQAASVKRSPSSQTLWSPVAHPSPSPSPSPLPSVPITRSFFQPYKFYVQIQMKTRKQVLSLIKKYGGTIIPKCEEADYLILSRLEKEFASLLPLCPPGIPAVSAAWVIDCDEEERMVDHTPYLENAEEMVADKIPSPTKPSVQKRGKASSASPSKPAAWAKKTAKAASSATVKPKTATTRTTAVSQKRTTLPAAGHLRTRGELRSPTPPTAVMPAVRGNLFTLQDDEYALECVRYLLARNPTTSTTVMLKYIAKNAPTHSLPSWQAHLYRKHKVALDRIRDEANRAQALAPMQPQQMQQAQQQPKQVQKPPINPMVQSQSGDKGNIGTNASVVDQLQNATDRVAQQIIKARRRGISPISAVDGMDMLDDETCVFAPNWRGFFALYEKQILQRVASLA
ncbi:hypothetical protein BKA62DRAFT_827541 [Auriculariales sp. MPI-PUGE-AT-0066]|nr:hypothetical protein BKA62DRAFT_827541 [Auriculariales sp. MPI-PUGE-AT-0066]